MLDTYLRRINDRDWMERGTSGTVRFALVGTGWWTMQEAIPAINASNYCEATVVIDRDSDALNRAADAANARAITPDEYSNGRATDDYDAVYVATPNGAHLEPVRVAANHGKDILCEKPLESSVKRARDLVDVCDDAGVTLMVAYRMQTEPLVRRCKDLLDGNVVGEVVQIHGDISATLLDLIPDPDPWRLDSDIAGGGSLMDIGIYPLNTIRFLLEEDPVTVSGTMRSSHPDFDDVEEHIRFNLQFQGDVGAVCTASLNAYGTSNLRIVGTVGLIELTSIFHPKADRGLVVEIEGNRSVISAENVNQMTEEFEYFAYNLLEDTNPAPNGHHGLRDMLIMDAIYEAARTGERTAVPYGQVA